MKADLLDERILAALEPVLGHRNLVSKAPMGGGQASRAFGFVTTGERLFVKTCDDVRPELYSGEASALQALRSSGTSLSVPEVLAFEDPSPGSPGFLVLPFLDTTRREHDFDERLGIGLALLHRHRAADFGFSAPTYCGATRQGGGFARGQAWPGYYAEMRLGPLIRNGVAMGRFDLRGRKSLERVLELLPTLLATDSESPSLIHGDLWAGNVLSTENGPALVDPSAYFAHREAEFGMMLLFGGFSSRVYEAYRATYPLGPGWEDRCEVYRLYHLINHAVLFGGSYIEESVALARSLVA